MVKNLTLAVSHLVEEQAGRFRRRSYVQDMDAKRRISLDVVIFGTVLDSVNYKPQQIWRYGQAAKTLPFVRLV